MDLFKKFASLLGHGSLKPVLKIRLDDAMAMGSGDNYVSLCGQKVAVTGVDLCIRAGEITKASLHIIPRRVDVVLPEGAKVGIDDYRWLRIQGVINEAQRRLWNNVAGWFGRRLYAPQPVDDMNSIWRISSDYFHDGWRYGLKTQWHDVPGTPAAITVDNVVEVFTLLKDEFVELESRALWIPAPTKYVVIGGALWKEVDGVSEKIADLPDQNGQASTTSGDD